MTLENQLNRNETVMNQTGKTEETRMSPKQREVNIQALRTKNLALMVTLSKEEEGSLESFRIKKEMLRNEEAINVLQNTQPTTIDSPNVGGAKQTVNGWNEAFVANGDPDKRGNR